MLVKFYKEYISKYVEYSYIIVYTITETILMLYGCTVGFQIRVSKKVAPRNINLDDK